MHEKAEKRKITVVEQINSLFSIMYGLFPSTYSVLRDQESLNHAKKVWHDSFTLHDMIHDGLINREAFTKGLKGMSKLNQQFMPSFGQFLNLCLNEEE